VSGLRAELRPYLVVWPAVYRLGGGTWRLVCRLTIAVMAGEGSEKAWRTLGAVAVGIFAGRVIALQPLTELPLLAAWTIAAWRAGPEPKTKTKPEQADGSDDQEEEQPGGEPAPEAVQPPPPLPLQQVAVALHAVADPHAHLSAAAVQLGVDTSRVRAALKQAGVPIHPVRVRGGGVSTGVKAADLPPLSSPAGAAPDGVVAAGQPSNNNTSGPVVERPHPGMCIVRDPAETARRRTEITR
jgi:hypothetical protein